MRLVYPFVTEFPESLASLEGWPVEKAPIRVGDDEAYWRLVRGLWLSGDDFCLVEQDMVPPPGALASIEACPETWCGVPYYLYANWGAWFGIVRFRGSLTAQYPELPDLIIRKSWHALDSAWINWLRKLSGLEDAHRHWPAAKHLVPKVMDWHDHFVQCQCGESLLPEDIMADPHVPCRSCGHVTMMNVPSQTATDSVW